MIPFVLYNEVKLVAKLHYCEAKTCNEMYFLCHIPLRKEAKAAFGPSPPSYPPPLSIPPPIFTIFWFDSSSIYLHSPHLFDHLLLATFCYKVQKIGMNNLIRQNRFIRKIRQNRFLRIIHQNRFIQTSLSLSRNFKFC